MVKKVNSGAQKISMMIKDLSDFSELNYTEAAFEAVDLNKIVSDVCAQLNDQIVSKHAVVTCDDLPVIQALTLQMEQLFYHLIGNSLKFARKDVPLAIQIKASEPDIHYVKSRIPAAIADRYVRIRVEDNAIGIEKSQLEKIFDIFSRLSYDHMMDGFGLGLAYCRKIIRNHCGFITAESAPAIGTTFTMLLPVDRALIRDVQMKGQYLP